MVVRDGQVVKDVNSTTQEARTDFDPSSEKSLKDYFDRFHTIRMENFKLSDDEIVDGGRGEIIVQPTKARVS